MTSEEDFIEYYAETPDVDASWGVLLSRDHLRAEVRRCPAGDQLRLFFSGGEAKVDDFEHIFAGDQDVREFEVSMEDVVFVQESYPCDKLGKNFSALLFVSFLGSEVSAKEYSWNGRTFTKLEYEACAALARERSMPLVDVLDKWMRQT